MELGFLDVSLPDDFFEPMTEAELADWEGDAESWWSCPDCQHVTRVETPDA